MSTRYITFIVTVSAVDDSADPTKAGEQIKDSVIWEASKELTKILNQEIKNDEYIVDWSRVNLKGK